MKIIKHSFSLFLWQQTCWLKHQMNDSIYGAFIKWELKWAGIKIEEWEWARIEMGNRNQN